MVRPTSIEAYNEIKNSGLLSERRMQVYDLLYNHGPCTGSELAIQFKKKYGMLAPNQANIVTRLGELRDCGAVFEKRTRECTITEMRVIEWEVTGNVPVKFEKPTRHRCPTCKGTGEVEDDPQGKLF